MTRRTLLILVAVLVSVFTFGPISPVSACELGASDQCVQMTATDHAALFQAAMGANFLISSPTAQTLPIGWAYAPENYAQMMAPYFVSN